MQGAMLLSIVLGINVLAFVQTRPEQESRTPPAITQLQITDLPLNRESQPLVLFERAVKDEKGKCKLHHHTLKVALVSIAYGLMPGPSKEYYEAERREFPNAITRYEGGCIIMNTKKAKVLQCKKCLVAKKVWIRRSAS